MSANTFAASLPFDADEDVFDCLFDQVNQDLDRAASSHQEHVLSHASKVGENAFEPGDTSEVSPGLKPSKHRTNFLS